MGWCCLLSEGIFPPQLPHRLTQRCVFSVILNPTMQGLRDGSVIKSMVARSLLLCLLDIQHVARVSSETKGLHYTIFVNLHLVLLATHR